MKKQHTTLSLLLLVFLFPVFTQDLPRIEPTSFFENASAQSEQLSEVDYLRASVLASGVSDRDANNYINLFSRLIDDVIASVPGGLSSYERGEDLLKSLHETLFNRYYEDQTRIDVVFQTGVYNCVSSAVIYMAVCRAAGFDVIGVKTRDHAFISLKVDSEIIDVETTNLWGFDPGKKKEFTDSFSGSTGFNYVPPGNYRMRQNISDRDMIGLILQNRIAEFQRQGNHRDSVPLAVDRYVFTGNEEARNDMYDTFSNYTSLLNASGHYDKGIEFLTSAIKRWGSSEKIQKAMEALVHNYVLSLVELGSSDEAEAYLQNIGTAGYISQKAWNSDLEMIYDRKTVDILNSGQPFAAVQEYLDKVLEEGFLPLAKWTEYTIYNYSKQTERLVSSGGWKEGYLFIRDAPSEIRNNQKYRQLLSSCENNYVVTIHNQFADLYNAARYSEAEAAVREGLAVVPSSRNLQSDLQMVQKKNSH